MITYILIQGEEGGERSLVLVMGLVYLLIAMLVLVVDESNLETGLGRSFLSISYQHLVFAN